MKRRGTGRSSDTQETLKETEFFYHRNQKQKKKLKKKLVIETKTGRKPV